jgi:hypothetical protein
MCNAARTEANAWGTDNQRVVAEPVGCGAEGKQDCGRRAHLSSVHVSFTTKTSSTVQIACAQKAVSRDVCCAARPRLALNHCRCVSTRDTWMRLMVRTCASAHAGLDRPPSHRSPARWALRRAAARGQRGHRTPSPAPARSVDTVVGRDPPAQAWGRRPHRIQHRTAQ